MAKDGHKKRKATGKAEADPNPAKKKATTSKNESVAVSKEATGKTDVTEELKPMTLKDILDRMKKMAGRIPSVPSSGFYLEDAKPNECSRVLGEPPNNLDKTLVREWASRMQIVLEELGLLLCCVSTATYRWGTDRSGAADQNLSLLNEELNSTQDQIASRVTPRLRNVLTPVVDLVVDETVTTKHKRPVENGEKDEEEEVEVKKNVFTRHLEDPDFVHLCYEILARNAPMMQLVVVSNFQKMIQCIGDYLAAQKNDSEHHRGFAY